MRKLAGRWLASMISMPSGLMAEGPAAGAWQPASTSRAANFTAAPLT